MRAIVSVSDKGGLVDFARQLNELGVEIYSTGGTKKSLVDSGIRVHSVSELTGFPEILDGRVKTLHPAVHGGILARRDIPKHLEELAKNKIEAIDMVVVNLYPFVQTVAKPDVTLQEALENIDIGGPTMIRAAAKNFPSVLVVVDPQDYDKVIEKLRTGQVDLRERKRLAEKAFQHVAMYDTAISQYLRDEGGFPADMTVALKKAMDLRYGENPHQRAALYVEHVAGQVPWGIVTLKHLHGPELSFNNFLDLEAAWNSANDFEEPTISIIKHTNPCGVGLGATPLEAYSNALSTDPVSAFGGIVAFNTTVDPDTAMELSKLFLEVVVAPDFTSEAFEILKKKKNLRLITFSQKPKKAKQLGRIRSISGGHLIQSTDNLKFDRTTCTVKTKRAPSESEWNDLALAWTVCKHVKSNAIVYAGQNRLVGVGAGQMSRIDSVRFGAQKAQLPLSGTVLASDAFFPFRDGIDEAARHKITAIIQPGGSIKDQEVIDAANEHKIAMVFTGTRHFRH
ncbi:MAG: bifunctional phosphoribosylaminoimidazolecarboxamide formyltransferase/IMP cyclohydrolase [Candidatus Bathyarchaeia archaeon]